MAGYDSNRVGDFLVEDDETIVQQICLRFAEHFQDVREQTMFSRRSAIPIFAAGLSRAAQDHPQGHDWSVIIAFPLLRLQERLDTVIIAGSTIAVIAFKVGSDTFPASDLRQVEDFALDLRDIHEPGQILRIWPVPCATSAQSVDIKPLV